MYIFLDESGCLGFDLKKAGTSRYFVMTALVSQQASPIISAVQRTMKAKINTKNKSRTVPELKGSHTALAIKQYFYHQLSRYSEWHLNYLVLDKAYCHPPHKHDIHGFYNQLACALLKNITIPQEETSIYLTVDKSKDQGEMAVFDNLIRTELAHHIPKQAVLRIDHLASDKHKGLQASDIFCYGISRKYEREDTTWYDAFSHHIKESLILKE